MSKDLDKRHLINEELYKILYLVKLVHTENISLHTFRQCLQNYSDEIKKLKRPLSVKKGN